MVLDVALRNYDLGSVARFARHMDEVGYGCLWTSETQHEPFLPLAVAASATSSLKLGTSIAVAFARSPMVLAYTAWDLQKASAGRFILGLGSQVKAHLVRRFSVKFEPPGPKLRELVLALRAIWDCWQRGTPLRFHGKFYTFELMTPFFNPGPIPDPQIPIFIAGVNQYMCRMAGEIADGLHVHPFHSPKYLREYVHPAVEEGLRTTGRTRRDFTYVTSSFVILGDTEAERADKAEAVREQIAFYASTRTYEPVLAAHGWEAVGAELHEKSLEGDWKGMSKLITDAMLDTFAVMGTYDNIGTKLRERYRDLLDRVCLYQPYDTNIDESKHLALVRQLAP